jgi:RNA polymerase sigma factor (sigma-70 family)
VVEVREFDDVWAEMRARLGRVLAARGVPAQDREDLLQETALRLYRVWDNLDPAQPVWPYAVTIALNLWRDSLRSAATHVREVSPSVAYDNPDDLDVERTVIARQELATVGAALRQLAPEQRRLVLETDELTTVVRPLRAAERMSRMRVRRELARVVGRASAIAALIWLRRPHRAQAFAAAAFTGALAVTVFSGSPAVSVTTAAPSAPMVISPAVARTVAVTRPAAAVVRHAAPAVVAHRAVAAPKHKPATHLVCAPASAPQTPTPTQPPPVTDGGLPGSEVVTTVVHTVTKRSIVTVPKAHTTNDGCVEVS